MNSHENYAISEPQLRHDDQAWLSQVAMYDIKPEEYTLINGEVIKGSVLLNTETDSYTVSEVKNARRNFFGDVLGWDLEDHPLHQTYLACLTVRPLPPPTQFIAGNRILHGYGIDLQKIIKRQSVLTYAPSSIQEKLEAMQVMGLDVKKVVNQSPMCFSSSIEHMDSKLNFLQSLGLNAVLVVNTFPPLLASASSTVEKKMFLMDKYLAILGSNLSAADIINKRPALSANSLSKLSIVARIIGEHGSSDVIPDRVTVAVDLLRSSLEAHIIAASQNLSYTLASVRSIDAKVSANQRQHEAVTILNDAAKRERVGQKIARAYMDYKR